MNLARIPETTLYRSLADLFTAAGMEADKASVVAEVLIEADKIGHTTHGTGLAASYIDALKSGEMLGAGNVKVVADRGACITWDGNKLPGPWLVREALDLACERVKMHGVVTVAIGRSHHTGALGAYMKRITDKNLIAQISCSTASAARMAPFGGTTPVLTPNPMAIAFPTATDPIVIDVSASITTTTMTRQLADANKRYPEKWGLTAKGEPTDDPQEVVSRGGTLMPLGGSDKGYKGFGLALGVDILSQGLSGVGRADKQSPMTLSVFIQVIDPAAFAGPEEFIRQSTHTAELCRDNPPAPGVKGVRVPGDSAANLRRRAEADGVVVDDAVIAELSKRASALNVNWL
ncbi:Ldh family oxidoreductase [Mesorhizobium sp. ZC-5]|uniref:Ldh family oxidoreductase n=1 Tax=Mesorhizobium sp. ZC-5 TaxID=2986066 RepID=UPI0039956EFA